MKASCLHAECGQSQRYGSGFCAKHHAQLQRGVINAAGQQIRPLKCLEQPSECVVEDCFRKPVSRGFCATHYSQWRRGFIDDFGVRLKEPQKKRTQIGTCLVDGCGQAKRSRGFCPKHYSQWRSGVVDAEGRALRDLKRVATYEKCPCKLKDCAGTAASLGFCEHHYRQYQIKLIDENGRVLREKWARQSRKGYRYVTGGYVKVMSKRHPNKDRDGYVMEHRLVMEKHLGRYLRREERVHHLNGTKDDNRLENLQLMSTQRDHPPFLEHLDEVDQALDTLDRLVNRNITGGPEIKKRLQRIARRLPTR